MSSDALQELRALLASFECKERTPRKKTRTVRKTVIHRNGRLTDLLKHDKRAKDAFRNNMLLRSRRRRGMQIEVPRSSSPLITAGELGDIGRAYDYWIRVVCIVTNQLGKDRFREFLGYKIYKERYARRSEFRTAVEACMRLLDCCYESGAFFERNLLWGLIVLGYFEREYRAGYPVFEVGFDAQNELHEEMTSEFYSLVCASDLSWLRGEVVLNPAFSIRGTKGLLLGDGDIVVDRTLYELKTSGELRPLETMRQLLGYVVMNSLVPRHEIDAVGFYYVRFNHRVRYSLRDVVTQEQVTALQAFMRNKLGRRLVTLPL